MRNKKIIVASLNWGLGHAARCIPIIKALLKNHFMPILASDGAALAFLQKEFPDLKTLLLPSYNIKYGGYLKTSLLLQIPAILKAVRQERKVIDDYIEANNDVIGIVSDNRFGAQNDKVRSVYLTHQLNVFSGWSTRLTTAVHRSIIKKFDECWIPDEKESLLSGQLSSSPIKGIPIKYTGVLSRFTLESLPVKNDVLMVLSGPEPNRTNLEEKLLREFANYNGTVVLVRGLINGEREPSQQGNIKIYDYLLSDALQKELNQSELVVCRSGYSSIMDLATLGKKAFFIPTKHQNEQEYLAKHLEMQQVAPFATEETFKAAMLHKTKEYSGFKSRETRFNENLLNLF